MNFGRDTLIKIKLKTAIHLVSNGKTVYVLIGENFERYNKNNHEDMSQYKTYALSRTVHGTDNKNINKKL